MRPYRSELPTRVPHPDPAFPALLVLPGLDGTGRRLGDFLAQLPVGVERRIIAFPVDEPLGYAELEARVWPLLPHGRSFVLLAESFSGPLAVRLAARAPASLAGMILCASFVRNPFPGFGWARSVLALIPFKRLPAWLRTLLLWNSGDAHRAPPQRERASAAVASRVLRQRLREALGVDERPRLRSLQLPVLVLCATRDRIVSAAASREIVAAAPHAQHIDIDGPHLLMQTRPRECAAAVSDFLRAVSCRAPT